MEQNNPMELRLASPTDPNVDFVIKTEPTGIGVYKEHTVTTSNLVTIDEQTTEETITTVITRTRNGGGFTF